MLALATLAGRLFVAGNFLTAAAVKVGHILAWDGFEISKLGLGVDGAVKTLAVFRGGLVAGGAFTRAFQPDGQVVSSGGLAFWSVESARWSLLGGASIQGDVTALLASGDTLYVAGRFSKIDLRDKPSTPARGLASYNAISGESSLFFITLGLELSDTKSLRALTTSPPRNCFSFLRSNCS